MSNIWTSVIEFAIWSLYKYIQPLFDKKKPNVFCTNWALDEENPQPDFTNCSYFRHGIQIYCLDLISHHRNFLYRCRNFYFIVPIIPEVLMEIDRHNEVGTAGNESIKLISASQDRNVSLPFTKQLLQESYKPLDENSRVGLLLSSKALIQILANPCVGSLSQRYCWRGIEIVF